MLGLFRFTVDREGALAALFGMVAVLRVLASAVVFADLVQAIGIRKGERWVADIHEYRLKSQHVMEERFFNYPRHFSALGRGFVMAKDLAGVVEDQEPRAFDG